MLMELELLWLLAPDFPSNKQINLIWSTITLGHKMPLPMGGYIWPKVNQTQRSDQMTTWPEVVSQLATRCLCLGVHLTTVQPDQSSNTLGHKMSLPGEGQVNILLDSQSASCNWPVNKTCEKMPTCQTVGWSDS